MPIAVFRPDPHPEVNSVDGYASRTGIDEAWGVIIVGAGTGANDNATSGYAGYALCSGTPNQYDRLYRGKFRFDTSPLGAGVTINSAVFSLHGRLSTDNFAQEIAVCGESSASDTTVTAPDYARANYGLVDFAPRIALAAWNNGGYNDFTLNAAGRAAINPIGRTSLGTMLSGDIDGVAPVPWNAGDRARAMAWCADNAGIAQDPMLTIDYSVGGGQSARARSGIMVPRRRNFRFG